MTGGWRATPPLGLLVAVLFAAFVVEQGPHLVHHLFEPGHVQDECAFLAGAERSPAIETGGLALDAPAPVVIAGLAQRVSVASGRAIAPGPARAPPAVVS